MAEAAPSSSSPSSGMIKVYATPDDRISDWANPRRVHLHKKTSSGITECCEPITAGGIIEDPMKRLLFMTCDRLVPADTEPHIDTNDGTCAWVGSVRHTTRKLHYTLITINDSVADENTMDDARERHTVPASRHMYFAALHPSIIYYYHSETDLILFARTRHNELVNGRITNLPTKATYPSCEGSRLMLARFESARGEVDVGMWVYARRRGAGSRDPETDERLERLDKGPYAAEVFQRYNDYVDYEARRDPLPLVGHVVEIRDRAADGSALVAVQGLHEVLTEIFTHGDTLNSPDGAVPPRTNLETFLDTVDALYN